MPRYSQKNDPSRRLFRKASTHTSRYRRPFGGKVSRFKKGEERKLTELEEKFCLKYFEIGIGTRAVLEAGYNQTEKAAATTANRLLKKDPIKARLKELHSAQEKRTEITVDKVLKELSHIAFFDLGEAFNDDGELLNVHKMPEGVRRALSGVKVFNEFEGTGRNRQKIGETTEIKPVDKTKALHLLGQHLKMFTERLEHSGPDGKAIEVKALAEVPDEALDERIRALLIESK
jgi:phage terminase small subunit